MVKTLKPCATESRGGRRSSSDSFRRAKPRQHSRKPSGADIEMLAHAAALHGVEFTCQQSICYHIGVSKNRMNNSNSAADATPPRVTLKLKTGARKSPRESKSPSPPQSQNPSKAKLGAHWSDEYKQSMQADMDKLLR
jgi:hypothetical protein